MRSVVVMVLIAAGCEGKRPASSPPPSKDAPVALDGAVAIDAAVRVNPNAGTGEPARRPSATALREAALPERTMCRPSCREAKMSPAVKKCYRAAQTMADPNIDARILMSGERSKGPCVPAFVVIDCCPVYKPTDLQGIAKKLGWAKASIEERKAIAWVIARVVIGGAIVDEDWWQDLPDGISMPRTKEQDGGVVLDYWLTPDGARSPQFVHEQLTFSAGGEVTDKMLERREGTLHEP